MRLVTADYHMRRALIEFRITAPDIEIWPNPVQPPNTGAGRWWRDRHTSAVADATVGKDDAMVGRSDDVVVHRLFAEGFCTW